MSHSMDSMDGMGGMDSMNSSDSSMSMMMMMKTYLHFTPGDVVLFDTIHPTSAGTIFATCLIFFLISVGDRYLRAVARRLEHYRVRNAVHLAEFEAANDSKAQLPEGANTAIASLIHYTLMLVVMTFNVAYIISIILGVVVGEIAFGRLNH
ncbi:Ctr copper transporter family-domain-containing protein [Favolaschia claudopus]|uniref:Copper transport protein n=1 Tax=Favolaschia claudopus TaxID=2862362 RepID=A0AAV9ZR26_9AGAR